MIVLGEKFITAIGAFVLIVGTLIVLVPLMTAFGALAGMIVGWFFGEAILYVMTQLGLRDVAMWQLGATLGFISSFLRTNVTRGPR